MLHIETITIAIVYASEFNAFEKKEVFFFVEIKSSEWETGAEQAGNNKDEEKI